MLQPHMIRDLLSCARSEPFIAGPTPQADVEGFEPTVMRSARNLLLKHSVENIIMEYSPGVGEHLQNWEKSEENPRIIAA